MMVGLRQMILVGRAVLDGADICRIPRIQVLLWRASDFGFGATMDCKSRVR